MNRKFGCSSKSFSRTVLTAVLAFEITLSPLTVMAQTRPAQMTAQPAQPTNQRRSSAELSAAIAKLTKENIKTALHEVAFLREFLESPAPVDMQIPFDRQDPGLDRDPFFLRSQSWHDLSSPATDTRFRKNEDASFDLFIEASKKALRIKVPLTPLHMTEEFIFLSADEDSLIFENTAVAGEAPGEGLFVLKRRDLLSSASNELPIPIFFLPLPGNGWKGNITSFEFVQLDALAIANSEDMIPLDLKDVETLIKVQEMNLMYATVFSMKNRGPEGDGLPVPGMTAAHGLFFAGVDLEYPDRSVWKDLREVASNSWFLEHLQKSPLFHVLFPQKAHALTLFGIELTDADILFTQEKLIWASVIVGSALVISWTAKWSHPGLRKKVREIEILRNGGQPLQRGVGAAIRREIRQVGDGLADSLTVLAKFPVITAGIAMEYMIDRNIPELGSNENSLVRRIYKGTYGYVRKQFESVAVSGKTLFYGFVLFGSMDTLNLIPQYLWATPTILSAGLPYASPEIQQQILAAIGTQGQAELIRLTILDTVRNLVAYAVFGASNFSGEARAQNYDRIQNEVIAKLRARGLNPNLPELRKQIEAEVNSMIDSVLIQHGSPSAAEFRYDAKSIWESIYKQFGFSAPEAGELSDKGFLLQNRPGLLYPTIDRAIEYAKKLSEFEQTSENAEVVKILEETKEYVALARNAAAYGLEGLRFARQMRRQLVYLSSEAASLTRIESESIIPEVWSKNYSKESVAKASILFRQSAFSFTRSEGRQLFGISEENLAHLEAQQRGTYTPPQYGWWERNKRLRAERKASEAVMREGLKQESDEGRILWRTTYRNEIAREVGIHLTNPETTRDEPYQLLIQGVEADAEAGKNAEIESVDGLKAWLEYLDPLHRQSAEAAIYANHFLIAYKNAMSSAALPAIHPQQPGRLQAIRQTGLVRKSAVMTRIARLAETFGDQHELRLSLRGSLGRSLPAYNDIAAAHVRLYKSFIPIMTTSYLWTTQFWQLNLPYGFFMVMVAAQALTIEVPSRLLNRFFLMQGIPQEGTMKAKLASSFVYTWITFGGMIPAVLWGKPVGDFFSANVGAPLARVLEPVDATVIATSAAILAANAAFKIVDPGEWRLGERLGAAVASVANGLRSTWNGIRSLWGSGPNQNSPSAPNSETDSSNSDLQNPQAVRSCEDILKS